VTTLVSIAGKKKQHLTCTQKSIRESLSDYTQQYLSKDRL
jgi:hypothetical protein